LTRGSSLPRMLPRNPECAMPKILLVDDEIMLLNSISYILNQQGYEVTCAENGSRALDLARQHPPDLILLDINLPDGDGFQVCRRLKQDPQTADIPVIMVTARVSADDVVEGFECSAEDYVTKPYQPRVLLARIAAVLRRGRARAVKPACRYEFGELLIEPDSYEVRVSGERIALTPSEFGILLLLVRNARRVLTRDQILDRIRGLAAEVTDRAVDFQISGLRRKLGTAARFLETIRGAGYKFTG
jgi:two-component system, OmpR family, alkaline phosphatase synthesis response regulator PhoP